MERCVFQFVLAVGWVIVLCNQFSNFFSISGNSCMMEWCSTTFISTVWVIVTMCGKMSHCIGIVTNVAFSVDLWLSYSTENGIAARNEIEHLFLQRDPVMYMQPVRIARCSITQHTNHRSKGSCNLTFLLMIVYVAIQAPTIVWY